MTEQNLQDPSMEDILSSIRRILSEDEEAAGDDVPAEPDSNDLPVEEPAVEEINEEVIEEIFEEPPPESLAQEPEEVLELTDNMTEQPEEVIEEVIEEVYEEVEVPVQEESLISQPVAAATACSLAELAKKISEDNKLALGTYGLTIEELVRQMLKPFVKEWLDANLLTVVERLVKKEIERVVDKAKW